MSIMAVLAGLAWRGMDGITRARAVSQEQLEQALRLNTVMAQWEQDLRELQETAVVSGLTFDGSTVRITRRSSTPTPGLQLVVWSLRPDTSSGTPGQQQLLRWASPPTTQGAELQEAWERSLRFQGQEAGQLRLLGGLSGWQLLAFRGNAWSNMQSSGDTNSQNAVFIGNVNSGQQLREQLPTGVRMTLSFASPGPYTGTLTRDIPLLTLTP